VKGFIIVLSEFANFKFSEPSLYFESLWNNFFTDCIQFQIVHLLLSDKLLTSINYPSDLRLLDEAQLLQLAQELRNFIIDVVSVKKDISAPV
jgi:hypothetical protein